MKSMAWGYDRRVRMCVRCHSWFLSEGAHRRYCALCDAMSEEVTEQSERQQSKPSRFMATVAVGEEAGVAS
jgi:predicted amidophosphoribosyltransferase